MKAVKSDLEYKHKFLQTDYEAKLQQHSLSLYMRINEKVLDLERQHKEKVAVLRKSFQQQLCDGLAVLRASYKKYYSRKEEKDQSSGSKEAGRLNELINEVQEKNAMIDYLSAQLKEYEEQALEETSLQPYEDPEKELLAHENEKLKDEIDTLHVDIERLSDCLDCKDKQLEHLGLSLQTMKEKAENDQITINKLVAENENLKRDLHVEKDAGRSKLKKLKEEMEKEIQIMQTSSKKTQEENAIRLAKIEQEKQLMWEQEEILRKSAQPKMVKNGEHELLAQLEGVQRIEKQQRKQIESLRKQLDRTIRMWEKKFDILKQSFHAIKDEMFLRQMLQRQAATLHHASVSYMFDMPTAFHGKTPVGDGLGMPSYSSEMPLPDIGSGPSPQTKATIDDDALNAAGSDVFPSKESQILSEDEEEEEMSSALPLPCPPSSCRQSPSSPNVL